MLRFRIDEKFNAYLFFNTWAGEDRFNHSVIRGNRLFVDSPTKPMVALGRRNRSVGLVLEDNLVLPFAAPPAVADVVRYPGVPLKSKRGITSPPPAHQPPW